MNAVKCAAVAVGMGVAGGGDSSGGGGGGGGGSGGDRGKNAFCSGMTCCWRLPPFWPCNLRRRVSAAVAVVF